MSDRYPYLCLPMMRRFKPARRFWQHEYFIFLLLLLAGLGLLGALFWQIGSFHDPTRVIPTRTPPTLITPKL